MKKAVSVVLLLALVLSLATAPVRGNHQQRLIWIPLDSRPVNTDEVALLGQAAGLQVRLPPAHLLDWYANTRSDFKGLLRWLRATTRSGDTQVIYTNNLLMGGLIASRDATMYLDLGTRLAALRKLLSELPPGRRIVVHVLPRVLPTQFRPDGSPNSDYNWRALLAERSELIHRIRRNNNGGDRDRLTKLEQALPEPVRNRYDHLIRFNEMIADSLLNWTREGLLSYIAVGLDDARQSGMANLLHESIQDRAKRLGIADRVHRHFGADEIGFLLLAKEALHQAGLTLALEVRYDQDQAPGLVLPYEGSTLKESVHQKLAFLGAKSHPGATQQLFVHTASAQQAPAESDRLVNQISLFRSHGHSITLADVTSPGTGDSHLLMQLARSGALAGLNYSGWNTASNALGTGMAMAALNDLHQQTGATTREVIAMETFRAVRLGYDWVYQSQKDALSQWAYSQGINPHHFGHSQSIMEARLADTVFPKVQALLRTVIGSALVEADGKLYAICVQRPTVAFRWDRTFEISIQPSLRLVEPYRGRFGGSTVQPPIPGKRPNVDDLQIRGSRTCAGPCAGC